MTRKNTGGPAFPVAFDGPDANVEWGMTLRDWFAGQALAYLSESQTLEHMHALDVPKSEAIARQAYFIADAMIAERSK